MKYMFISDIHGSVEQFSKAIEIFYKENADKLILLGDTSAYMNDDADFEISNVLNDMKRKVEIIRGNSDTSNFESLLDFEMYDMDNLYVNGKFVSITHGHYYNMYRLPENCGDIFIQGHTHVPILLKQRDRIFANPGSISRPRGTYLKCYIIIDEKKIVLKSFESMSEISFIEI